MEAKEKAIREVYGEHWERLKDTINREGVFVGDTYRIDDKTFEEWDFVPSTPNMFEGKKRISGSRPKSLRGIETNNGWNLSKKEDSKNPFENNKFYEIGFMCKFSMEFTHQGVLEYNNGFYVDGYYLKPFPTHYKEIFITKPIY